MRITIKVDGMSCMHCVGAVENALAQVEGVSSTEVVLQDGIAIVEYDCEKVCAEDLINAVEEQGFDAEVL